MLQKWLPSLALIALGLTAPLLTAHAMTDGAPAGSEFNIPDTVPEANHEAFKALWPLYKEFASISLDISPGQPGTESHLEKLILNQDGILHKTMGREHGEEDQELGNFLALKQFDQADQYVKQKYPDLATMKLINLGRYCHWMGATGRFAQNLACVKQIDRMVGAALPTIKKDFRLPTILGFIPLVGAVVDQVNGKSTPNEIIDNMGVTYSSLADYYISSNQHAKAIKAGLASSLITAHCTPSSSMTGTCEPRFWAGLMPNHARPAILGLHAMGRTADADKLYNLAMAAKWNSSLLHEQSGKNELAFSYLLAKGNFLEAREVLRKQAKDADNLKVGFFEIFMDSDWVNNISKAGEYLDNYRQGRLALELGEMASADAYYANLTASPLYSKHRLMADQINLDLARLRKLQGRKQEAVALYQAAIEALEAGRRQFPSEAEKMGFVDDKQDAYASLIGLLIEAGRVEDAFLYAERAKARTLVDLLADQQLADRNGVTAEQVLKQAGAAAPPASSGPETIKVAMAASGMGGMAATTSGTRSARVLAIRQNLGQQSAELASLISVDVASLEEIRGRLNPGEAIVEYFQHGNQLLAFVVNGQRVQVARLKGEGLEQEVSRFREALAANNEPVYRALQQSLHDRLFHPLRGMITEKSLAIVAHGPLHYLPFASLSDGKRTLIDDFALRTLPSATVLKFLKPRARDNTGTLVFGNPDLGNRQYDLAFAEEEARRIAQARPQNKLLLRKEASELAAKNESAKFGRVHFASHAVFEPDEPLKSGLMLAAEGREDGRLTLGEIYGLKLNADLVVLSACETGIGKISKGDEVVGLTRGFLYSGAATVVSSLWKVDDAATGYLMETFYAEMDRGTGKHEALRKAQLATRKKFPSPYYWAAFQITGNVQ
jgi:CHAT domain-containing protein